MAEAQDYLVDEGREIFEQLLRAKQRRLARQDAVVVEVSDEDSSSCKCSDSSEPDPQSIEEDEESPTAGVL